VFHRRGLTVREFAGEGLRVSIGEQESVDDLLRAAQEVVDIRQPGRPEASVL
jgi:histidinol-phosphate aminotransferase